jgi:hypothetical protein
VRRAVEVLLAFALATAFAAPATAEDVARRHVTFILGADPDGAGYFTAATRYFREHAAPGEEIVPGLRSLEQVREYLARNAPAGEAPWGTVRLVAHGSQWYGLRVPVFAGAPADATLAALEQASSSGAFPPLRTGAVDAQTHFIVESCGIARRPRLMQAIARLFFGDRATPVTQASREYVEFRTWVDASGNTLSDRSERPYAAAVTRESMLDSTLRSSLQTRLRALWAKESGREAMPDLAMHTVPIEIRQPIAAAAARVADPPALRAALFNLGLASHQLRWNREGDVQVGRATLVILAEAAEGWAIPVGPP